MTDPRITHARELDDAATRPPWRAEGALVVADQEAEPIAEAFGVYDFAAYAEAEVIAAARNMLPFVIRQEEGVLERHYYDGDLSKWSVCMGCAPDVVGDRPRWPCPEAQAALEVLAQIGNGRGHGDS
jgi:hypothetical protein